MPATSELTLLVVLLSRYFTDEQELTAQRQRLAELGIEQQRSIAPVR